MRPSIRAVLLTIPTMILVALPVTGAETAKAKPSRHYTIEQFMATTSMRGASFSPGEDKILYSSNESGIFNVYSIPVAGGVATPVTSSTTDTTYAVSYFPKDERFLYTRDRGGDENNHLYVREASGQEKDLTPGDKLKARFLGWAHDKGSFYVAINDRDARFFDIHEYDATSYQRTLLYKDETGYEFGAISPDEKWLAFEKPEGTADSDIYLWNVTAKKMSLITDHEGQAEHNVEEFDVASKRLYYLTNAGSEFKRVRSYDLSSAAHQDVEKSDWDIEFTRFSHGGAYRVTGINEDGRTVIRIHDMRSGTQVPLPAVPDGEVTSVRISDSEKRMSFYVNGDRSPNDLYVWSFGDQSVRRLTDALSKEIDREDLVESQVVRFKSFDGMAIPNILYKPHQATPERKAPALVLVHGGPGGQTRPGYNALRQYLVNHGYVVLGINNRGSSGYGQTFYTADDGKHGREPLWDCVEGKNHLASLPYVDSGRIGIIGGSYGGYMVLAALAYQPEVFGAGVDIFGVSNWVRTLESIPPYWESFRVALYKEIGDPSKDQEMLKQISPLFSAAKIKRPLLVLQGANDPRVIKPESDDIVAAVKKNGVPVEYIVFDDEGHGFSKKANEIKGYGAVLAFLDKYLKDAAPWKPAGKQEVGGR